MTTLAEDEIGELRHLGKTWLYVWHRREGNACALSSISIGAPGPEAQCSFHRCSRPTLNLSSSEYFLCNTLSRKMHHKMK